ncbi:hypothetical protein C942_03782 [Photobacterium marinum]|uniref:Lysozyme inhibitor LprI-like N-terminal domain-containing protein n=1 Tax=Photobacterium marinum TaxID=1056511 RepID=L8J3H8_9GAMM|nr:lysozyme inhibitor LprI family protein [Photobacterium marinum]ELR63415.1 hypothetical protein C942_03782 [Photobacterium marinum]
MLRQFSLVFVMILVMLSAPVFASSLADCSEKSEGHQALSQCLEQAYQQADEELQALEKQVQGSMAELDAISSADIGAEAAFSQSVTAFRTWREQQCRFVMASYGSGSGAGQGYLDCMEALTSQQVDRLKEYAN